MDRILDFLCERRGEWFDDEEIRRAVGIKHHAQVNSRCRQLAEEGKITRRKISGKLKNICQEELVSSDYHPKEIDSSISLERDLEAFIFEKINTLEDGLKPYKGKSGRQYTVESGRIDILATDKEGDFVVIELKAGTARDEVLTQTLSYMVDICKNAGQKMVRGIIIAHDFSDKLVLATSMVMNIELVKYKVKFDFERL